MRILTLLMLAVVVGTGHAWAATDGPSNIKKGTVSNGSIEFYADEACTMSFDTDVAVGATVYVKATAAPGYTAIGVTFTATKGIGTNLIQAPRRIGIASDIAVSAVTGKPDIYSFTMPEDVNFTVTVSATFATPAQQLVSYVDGSYETKEVNAYVLDETMHVLPAGFYIVPEGVLALDNQLNISGNVNLILADGCQMSATTISGSESQLTIYAQTGQTGQMVAAAYDCGVALGQRFVAYNMASEGDISATAVVSGTISDVTTIAGKTLKPLDGPVVSIGGEDFSFGKDADFVIGDTHYYKYAADDNVTLSYTGSGIVNVTGATLAAVANEPLQRTFTMPATDVALTATAVTDLTATDIIYGEATPEIKQGDDVFATANYAFVYKSGDEVITEPTVGTYTCTLTGLGQYFGTTNVAIKVKPRPITIAAGSATKKYDGTPLTSPYYECTLIDPDDRLNGIPILNNDSIANLTITGSQTNVGESANVPSNAVITRRGDATVDITSCYDITYCNGTLEVITNDTLITVIPGSGSKYYDGTPLTMTAHDDFDVTGVPEVLTWEATADGIVTNVTPGEGEKSENAVTSFQLFDANHVDVTSYFTNINKKVGTLTILPRQTTIAVVVDNANTITAGGDVRVKVTLVPVKKEEETTELPMINGIATISVSDGINGAKSYNVAVVDGEGEFYVTNLGSASYSITASFAGDANHDESTSAVTTLEVCKIPTELDISLDKTQIYVGDTATVSIKLDQSMNAVVTLKFTDKEEFYNDINHNFSVALPNGKGTFDLIGLAAGTYRFAVVYAGDDTYVGYDTEGEKTLTLTVSKRETGVSVSTNSPVIAK